MNIDVMDAVKMRRRRPNNFQNLESDPSSSSPASLDLDDSTLDHHLQFLSDFREIYHSPKQEKITALSSIRNSRNFDFDFKTFTQGNKTVSVENKVRKEEPPATGSDSFADYSESDLKDLSKINKDYNKDDKSAEDSTTDLDLDDSDQIIISRKYSSPRTNAGGSKNAREEEEVDSETLEDGGKIKEAEDEDGNSRSCSDDGNGDEPSDSKSDSETEQERWDQIVETVQRMKLLLTKYPKFATRVGSNNIISSLQSMMDALEGRGDQPVSSIELEMVEDKMEQLKTTLLAGIDEDLTKWRTQKKERKHRMAKIFSVFTLIAVCASFYANFISNANKD